MAVSKREQIEPRIRAERQRNASWQQEIGRRWLCPYCGNLVTLPKEEGDAEVSTIAAHLADECLGCRDFQGELIPLRTLRNKRLVLLVDHKLHTDPVWKLFDEAGHWHCPFSMQRVTMPSSDPAEIGAAIREHLKHSHAFNHGKGKPASLAKMQQAVDRANSIDRLVPHVREVVTSDKRWQERALDGSWVCPFCLERIKNIDISTEILRTETSPRLIAEHLLLYCAVFQKVQVRDKQGQMRPPENLVRITNYIEKHRDAKSKKTDIGTTKQITAADLEPGKDPSIGAALADVPVAAPSPAERAPKARGNEEKTRRRARPKADLKPADDSGVVQMPPRPKPGDTKARGGGWQADKSHRQQFGGSGESGVGDLAAEGFSLSVDVGDDSPTTWDVLTKDDAGRVNSGGGEGIRTPPPPSRPISQPNLPVANVTPPTMVGIASPAPASGPVVPAAAASPAAAAPAAAPPAAAPPSPAVGTRAADRPSSTEISVAPPPAPPAPSAEMEADRSRIIQQAVTRARRSLMEMIGPIPRARGYELGAIYRPSPTIDGDFFQFFELGDGRFAMCVWETSVHGMDGVPLTRHFLETIRRLIASGGEPRQILVQLNSELHHTIPGESYFSAMLAILDTTAHTLSVCNAGFQPLLLYNQFRSPDLDDIDTNGIVIGSDEGSLFQTVLEQKEIELRPQDLVIAHSQGVAGFVETTGLVVDVERFHRMIREHGRQDASYFLSMADAEYKRLRGGQPPARDLTVLAIKRL